MKDAAILVAAQLFLLAGSAQDEDTIASVHFQSTGAPDVTSMLRYRSKLPELPVYTICVRVRLHRHRLWSSIFSYGKRDDVTGYKDQLVLGLTESSNEIWSFGNQLQGLVTEAVQLHQWRHTCYVVDLQNLLWRVFVNDQYWEGRFQTELERGLIPGGGFLVLGQEQDDDEDSGYSKRQSFNGELSDFYMFDYLVTDEDIRAFLRCEPLQGKYLITFENLDETFDIQGNTDIEYVSRKSLCQHSVQDEFEDYVFPEGRSYANTQTHCQKFRADLTLPLNDEENDLVFQKLQPYSQECFHASGSIVWINAYFFVDAGQWLHASTKKDLNYTIFAGGYGSGSNERNCPAIFHVHPFESLWGHHTCGQKFCGMCRIETRLQYRVRGLCSSSKIDTKFFASGYRNKKIQFMGFYTSTIYWNNSTWVLSSLDGALKDLYGEMNMGIADDYPVGRHAWTISGDSCGRRDIKEQVNLLITTCPEGGFTCDSGHCVHMTQRCDQNPDCQDESDEHDCSLVEFPQGYNKDLQPPQASKDEGVVISVKIIVKGIRRVDLIDESFYINVQENLEWFDDRLRYLNLKKDSFLNVIPRATEDMIWLPNIKKQDGSQQDADVTPRGRSTVVIRSSSPSGDDIALSREDYYYDGSLNRLALSLETSAVFTCRYDFVDYPFDLQTCTMVFKLESVTSSHAVLRLKDGDEAGIAYKGSRRLLEYEVMDLKATNSSVGLFSCIKVTLVLRNLYQYYISSTFIPTTLLIVINLLTFRYRLDDFQNRIMVSLTVLLVLSSLFSQVSASVPKTSYVKLIDLWFLLAIVYVFLNLIFLILIEHKRNLSHQPELQHGRSNIVKVMPRKTDSGSTGRASRNEGAERLNDLCKNFLSVMWVVMIVSYIVIASVGVKSFVG
ncbi:uncharacterized protein LOC143030934 [Oratosquilla oratoria]|uniref:uncharacterized protein LOC143030934 n=1 Tax=Oratosquilla oratoria TaxID=337810 RepID=UPI003F758908